MEVSMNTPPPDHSNEHPKYAALRATGSVLMVMVRAAQLQALPFLRPPGADSADDTSREQRPLVPPMLTPDAHAEALSLGVALRSGVAVMDICDIFDSLARSAGAGDGIILDMTRLTLEMIRASFAAMLAPPQVLLDLDEAANLIRIAPATLSRLVSQGRITKSVKRGKPLVFFRDLLVQEWTCP
jgi:hypothetical protein